MSMEAQARNMKVLSALLSQDLGYIAGPKESGPNGAKAKFLSVGKSFLRTLAKDLHCQTSRISANPAGFGVSGSVSLYGMWSNGTGIMVQLEQNSHCGPLLYRRIHGLQDYRGGQNNFVSLHTMERETYQQLLYRFGTLSLVTTYDAA